MPVEGRDLRFRRTSRAWRTGDWYEPGNSRRQGSKTARGVTGQSQGNAELLVLSVVRQGASGRRVGIRLPTQPGKRRRTGSGWPDIRRHQEVRGGTMAW